MKMVRFLLLSLSLIAMVFCFNSCEDKTQEPIISNDLEVRYVSEVYTEYLWVNDEHQPEIDKDRTYKVLYFRDEDPKYLLGYEFYEKNELFAKARFINEGKTEKQVGVDDREIIRTTVYLDDARTLIKEEYNKEGRKTQISYDDKNRKIGLLTTIRGNMVITEETCIYGDSISYGEIKHYSYGELSFTCRDTTEYYDADCKKKKLVKTWLINENSDDKEYIVTEYEYGAYGETKYAETVYSVADSGIVTELRGHVTLTTWIDDLNNISLTEAYSAGVKISVEQRTTRLVK
jgi:hypothetical protein